MNMRQTTIAAAVLTALTIGAASQAAASVYARSYLDISKLVILPVTFTGPGGSPVVNTTGVTVGNYTFSGTNTASLNNAGAAVDIKGCSGTFGGATTCGASGNRLDPLVVNAGGSTVIQGENTFTFNGPGAGQYANADGKLFTASVAGDASTHTTNIAESELQTGIIASSTSVIDSITKFTFQFSTTAAGTLMIAFDAIQNMLAAISDPTGTAHQATGTMNTELKISNDANAADFVLYNPDGSTVTGCGVLGTSFTCTEANDPFSLNTSVATSTDGTSSPLVNSGSFLTFIGLKGAGTYTFTLSEKKSTTLSRVPEPGIMSLLGIGLLGMGLAYRRKNNA